VKRLSNIAAAGALVVCAVLAVLMIESWVNPDTMHFTTRTQTSYFFDSRYGRLRFVRQSETPNAVKFRRLIT